MLIIGLASGLPGVEFGTGVALGLTIRFGLTTGVTAVTVFGLAMRLGARWGVEVGLFRGLGGWKSLGSSVCLGLLGLLIPKSLLKKLGFFTVPFSPRCVRTESACR